MSTEKIIQLMNVGQLGMDLWRAHEAVANAEGVYHDAIAQYEARHGRLDRLIRKDDPAHGPVREFTAPKYKALQKAKRRVYAIKVRMAKACAKMARMSAERAA
ncbi:hypothetical protein AAKU55_003177 [Oxalobacteraceae bacterium GrIS 1.11]